MGRLQKGVGPESKPAVEAKGQALGLHAYRLEHESQRKLHDSRAIRPPNLTITDIVWSIAGFSRRRHVTAKEIHIIPLGVVEGVEVFPAELQGRMLTVEPR